MGDFVKYLFSGVAAAVATFFAPEVWSYVAVKAIGPQAQEAILVGIAAILGGVLGEKLGFQGRK